MTFLLLGFFVAPFSACSDDPESEPETPEPIIPHFELGYAVSEDMLALMDIEIIYMDTEGVKQTETMTTTTWNETFIGETLPAKVGYKVQFTLKENISLDKEVYTISGGVFYNIYTMQGSSKGTSYSISSSGSTGLNKNKILEYLEEGYIKKGREHVWEITADGTLAEDSTIDWSE